MSHAYETEPVLWAPETKTLPADGTAKHHRLAGVIAEYKAQTARHSAAVALETAADTATADADGGPALGSPIVVPDGPVVPAWMTSSATLKARADEVRQLMSWRLRFHAVRSPIYAARVAGMAARGTWRGTRWLCGYLLATDYAPEIRALREAKKHKEARALRKERTATMKKRAKVVGGVGGAAVAAVVVAAALLGLIVVTAAAMAVLVAAVIGGRPGDDGPALLDTPEVPDDRRPWDNERVTEAFTAAGITTAADPVRVQYPGVVRSGDGWLVTVDLPRGKKAAAALAKREELASALAVDEVQVHMERVRGRDGHSGRLSLWVADNDPFDRPPTRSPLATEPRFDLWQPIPVGTDARGRQVTIPIVWNSLLVGAIPRQGKTFTVRAAAIGAALDPHVRLIVADGKGGKDWVAFAEVAHRYIRGVRPDAVEALVAALREAQAEMNERYDRLGAMPDAECPEGKLTPELARNGGMPLVVIVIDELQRYLEDATHGSTILETLVDLAKVAPACGIMLVLATQRPDAECVPPALRDNISYRHALRVMNYQSSEVILGAGTKSRGMDASTISAEHKGVGILLDETGAGTMVRSYLVDLPELRGICERGRALREAAGTLTGDAARGTGPAAGLPVLAALREALAAAGDPVGIATADVLAHLAATDPEGWGDRGSEAEAGRALSAALVAELEGAGVGAADMIRPTAFKLGGEKLRGYRLDRVQPLADRFLSGTS